MRTVIERKTLLLSTGTRLNENTESLCAAISCACLKKPPPLWISALTNGVVISSKCSTDDFFGNM